MAVLTICSLGHSPGVTTTALALVLEWPRPCLLVEADPSVTSQVLAGRLRGTVPHVRGLGRIASAQLDGELTPMLVRDQTVPLDHDRFLLPGFVGLGAARGADRLWGPLAQVLAALEADGLDVIVDLGRLTDGDARTVLALSADLVLVATGCSLPDVAATVAPIDPHRTALGALTASLAGVGHPDAALLVGIERAQENYSPAEIRRVTGRVMIGTLPFAPEAAAMYSTGTPTPARRAATYRRRIRELAASAGVRIAERRARLAPAPSSEVA